MKAKQWIVLMISLGLVWTTLGASFAFAQAPAPGQEATSQEVKPEEAKPDVTSEIELTRAIIQVKHQAIVTRAMDLNETEAQAFWPLYREYRLEMSKVGDRFVTNLVAYLDNYENLSDQLAEKLLNEALSIEKARLDVKAKYIPRFRKVIPAKKVARFFQVDNKLEAFIKADLASQIPLVR
jgi:hypothetical protein